MVFTCSICDGGMLPKVNEFFAKETETHTPCLGLVDVGKHAGGTKATQACVWVGAFNYLDEAAFFAHLRTTKWKYPTAVRIFVNHEHADGFEVTYMIDGQEVPYDFTGMAVKP